MTLSLFHGTGLFQCLMKTSGDPSCSGEFQEV